MNNPSLTLLAKRILSLVEAVGLAVIAIATVIATSGEVLHMIEAQRVGVQDLLLLFIYLEVLVMIGLYFESGQLPMRYPIYIAIVALARYLILGMETMEAWRILAIAGAMLVLALTVLALRFGSSRFPYTAQNRASSPESEARDR